MNLFKKTVCKLFPPEMWNSVQTDEFTNSKGNRVVVITKESKSSQVCLGCGEYHKKTAYKVLTICRGMIRG